MKNALEWKCVCWFDLFAVNRAHIQEILEFPAFSIIFFNSSFLLCFYHRISIIQFYYFQSWLAICSKKNNNFFVSFFIFFPSMKNRIHLAPVRCHKTLPPITALSFSPRKKYFSQDCRPHTERGGNLAGHTALWACSSSKVKEKKKNDDWPKWSQSESLNLLETSGKKSAEAQVLTFEIRKLLFYKRLIFVL